jgi:hypothetical protein
VILGLADRIEAALKSNLPPAEIEKLSPAVRRLLAELRQRPKSERGDLITLERDESHRA